MNEAARVMAPGEGVVPGLPTDRSAPDGRTGAPLLTFETLGNATIQFAVDGKPILSTDPWLVGTCYFGSWALDHPLTDEQIRNVQNSEFIWISHGHPDHLHHESLRLIPRGKTILIPDHYDRDIAQFLAGEGFTVEILPYRGWRRLHPQLEILCLDNENQDAILIARFGDALVINLNDSPYFGEFRFIRRLVRDHPNDRVFMLQLCSIDADMKNIVDADGERVIELPEVLKPGAVWSVARRAALLGARYFCCSSSQHIYVRADSVWANPYRITIADMRHHWNRSAVELVPPFVTMDVAKGVYVANHPSEVSDQPEASGTTAGDDWDERLSAAEWQRVEDFFARLQLLGRFIDFIEVSVGGETRHFSTRPARAGRRAERDGITFIVPRRSLLEAVAYGYFDDLLIGNFMRTRLHGRAELYPYVSPVIAKLGGNAKVYDRAQYLRFVWRYLRRNPLAVVSWRFEQAIHYMLGPRVRRWAARLGVFDLLKTVYRRWYLGDPAVTEPVEKASGARAVRLPTPPSLLVGKQRRDAPDLSSYDRPRLIVSIDTEEDFDWAAPFSPQANAVHSMAQQHLAQQIFEKFALAPIYLCDFPIAEQDAASCILREWVADGRCAIGAQLHPWVNPPHLETVNSRNSYPCNLPLDLQRAKLARLTERITDSIGARPRVYKAGRHGADEQLVELLKPLGYQVDISINPIRDYRRYGGPNHITYPHAPFWLDSERELLAIPLTGDVLGALRRYWVPLAGPIWSPPSERLGLTSVLRHLKLINRVTLTPEGVPLDEAIALTRFLVAGGHRVFTLWYHSTSLTPGSAPYVRSRADLQHFLGWIEAYLEFFVGELGGVPVLPTEIHADARGARMTPGPPSSREANGREQPAPVTADARLTL
jgi:hypothetical protein